MLKLFPADAAGTQVSIGQSGPGGDQNLQDLAKSYGVYGVKLNGELRQLLAKLENPFLDWPGHGGLEGVLVQEHQLDLCQQVVMRVEK